jgi:hypothetical protein
VIGHIAQAYRRGRLDALAGIKADADPGRFRKRHRTYYLLGHHDETERMRARHECPQLELDLGLPQIPQDRRLTPPPTTDTPF